jgi:hypothetical protein
MLKDPTPFTAGGLRIVVVCPAVGVRCIIHDTIPHASFNM